MISAKTLLAAALLLAAVPAAAQDETDAPQGELAERTSTAIVYGDEACPKAQEDEIVICARRPEGDRYRIPKELRHKGDPLSETSWGARNELLEEAARANLPGSCSVVGSYGQSGCQRQFVDQWYNARRARRLQ
ncbi:MAG TPA: hypothetical protein VGB65_07635 [Allosphingosinicella sp.]